MSFIQVSPLSLFLSFLKNIAGLKLKLAAPLVLYPKEKGMDEGCKNLSVRSSLNEINPPPVSIRPTSGETTGARKGVNRI
jgi:hypothetical protein